jgi:hypothetical protein
MEVVYHPDWFLDPARRPAVTVDFDAAAIEAKGSFPPDAWDCALLTLSPEQLRVATAVIPTADAEAMLAGLVANRFIMFNSKDKSNPKQIAFVVYELNSAEAATLFVAGEELVMRAKDEMMKSGAIRISSAEYSPLSEAGLSGVLARKEVLVGNESTAVVTLCASRGRMAIETMFNGMEIGDEEHIALAASVSAGDAVRRRRRDSFDFEDVEVGASLAIGRALRRRVMRLPTSGTSSRIRRRRRPARAVSHHRQRGDTFNLSPRSGSAKRRPRALGRAARGLRRGGSRRRPRVAGAQRGGLLARALEPARAERAPLRGGEGRAPHARERGHEVDAAAWHRLKCCTHGTRVEVFLDDESLLTAEDPALEGDGQVGLWTKADASTVFDALTIDASALNHLPPRPFP